MKFTERNCLVVSKRYNAKCLKQKLFIIFEGILLLYPHKIYSLAYITSMKGIIDQGLQSSFYF